MEEWILVKPESVDLPEIAAYKAEMKAAKSSFDGCGSLENIEPEAWLQFIKDVEHEDRLPENYVTAELYCAMRAFDRKILGMIQLRHYFNDFLRDYGGHIGYSVRPSERRSGVAKFMLASLLPKCIERGLATVLITCLVGNEGSKKTILSGGGVYESTVYCESMGVHLERYWIDLSK